MQALVRRPGPRLAEGVVTHIARRPIDVSRAREQWAAYVRALAAAGWETVEVGPADDCADAVFVEDTVVVYRSVAVIARPGLPSRRQETAGVADAVAALGYTVARISSPATLDGGDVLTVGERVYVGVGGRTNGEGVRQLRAILEPLGASVVEARVQDVLHLKSAVTALPDGTVIGYRPLPGADELFPAFRLVPEESGAHVVVLGGRRLLLAADCPRSADLFAGLGYEPVVVDIGELQKLEGCVTCLSVLLR